MMLTLLLMAVTPPIIVDEAKVPPYTLPDPLVCADGRKVTDAKTWNEVRRPEVFRLVEENMFGRTPDTSKLRAGAVVEVREQSPDAFGGKAVRTQFKVWPIGKQGPSFDMLLFVPTAAKRPSPVFVGLNFSGNHTTVTDPAVFVTTGWVAKQWALKGTSQADPGLRGDQAGRWQTEALIDRGYASATAYYGDFEPDHPEGWRDGFRGAISPDGGLTKWKDGDWAAIGCWAWGLSRMLDVLEGVPSVDGRRAAVHGHSRLGKASLWAGAQDPRFALVISNESGCGGAALNKRLFGETIGVISGHYPGRGFPHWFTQRFGTFSEREDQFPLDAHFLLALIAPRPLYVASASEDLWADPLGEFLGAAHADPVYQLLAQPGLGTRTPPPVSTPVGGTIGYHLRPGRHDILPEDWKYYVDFADRVLPAR